MRYLMFISVIFYSFSLEGQAWYSKNYFRWPVSTKPGIAANFGELRSDHWHMGLDIRTDQKENMPVYAAAGGYISKISVQPFGYGKAIYINHPNGLTTVYGHLNKFFPKLDSFVIAQQYKKQSWEIVIDFDRKQFPLSKGQFIAYSGNTGGSQGPHVHFEIRNTKTGSCINPLFFNFPIPDKVAPVFTKLAMYDRTTSVYDQTPVFFPIKKTGSGYIVPGDTLLKTGLSKLSFAIGANDRVSGSTNPNGIYSARIFFDKQPLIDFVLDSMNHNETNYINAHIDYRFRYNSGSYLQQLFKLPGDNGRVYRPKENSGLIQLTDTNIHRIRIEIGDIEQNVSILEFNLQYSDSLASQQNYNSRKAFIPNQVNIFEQPDFEIYLGENCLYDTVHPAFYQLNRSADDASSQVYKFGDASIPIHGELTVRIDPDFFMEDWRNKMMIKRTDGKTISYRKAGWQGEWLSAKFQDFGSFQAFADTMPPTINELGKGDTVDLSPSKTISFYPKDNTGIKNFRAELNGEWLMFSNDKGRAHIYGFDKRCPFGVHRLTVRIEDIAGNVTEKEWWFKRYPYKPPKKKTVKKKGTRNKVQGTRKTTPKKKNK